MNEDVKKRITEIIASHKKAVEEFEAGGIEVTAAAAEAITKSLKHGRCVYICGNGGSAADAQHIAGEFVCRFSRERKGLAAVALSTDSSVITSIGNDYSYEKIFERQVEALVKQGDILWAISTSGNSANIIAAARSAKEKGASVLAFTGKSGSRLEEMADICLCANDESTARSQEVHQLAYHIICGLVEENFVSSE